jgi:cation diffusion facilitator family transporter
MFFHRISSPTHVRETSNEANKVLLFTFGILFVTGVMQIAIVYLSSSLALLADTIHNFADALTSIPLGIAFYLTRFKSSDRFNFGYGRFENVSGLFILGIVLFSGIVAAYEAIHRILYPQSITHIAWVILAAVLGFAGNEWVARLRLKTGHKIHSAALIADGQHARTDSWTSLSVLVGAVGTLFGFPLVDTLIGLGISCVILWIVWESGKPLILQLLDGIDSATREDLKHHFDHETRFKISSFRAKWVGHHLEVWVYVQPDPRSSMAHFESTRDEFVTHLKHHLPIVGECLVLVETPHNLINETPSND